MASSERMKITPATAWKAKGIRQAKFDGMVEQAWSIQIEAEYPTMLLVKKKDTSAPRYKLSAPESASKADPQSMLARFRIDRRAAQHCSDAQ